MSLFSCRNSLVSGPGGGAERPAAGLLLYNTSILMSLGILKSKPVRLIYAALACVKLLSIFF